MEYNKLTLLLAAMTKGGKTTIVWSLCKKEFRKAMSKLCDFRTGISVDWIYAADTNKISLTEVFLNDKNIFGTDIKENINCEKFNEILNGEEGTYLKNTLNLENQLECQPEDLIEYVKGRIKEYINDGDVDVSINRLRELIKNRTSHKFIRRIEVIVPPEENFAEYLKEKEISFVLRDTRGFLDMNDNEAEQIKYWTMQELGIDGIDAVLLLGTSAQFADTLDWYKNAYKDAFESVPIFIMARDDGILSLFDLKYEMDENNINTANVKEFLEAAKKGQEKGFKDFYKSFLPSYELLKMFEMGQFIGQFTGNEVVYKFEYKYKVYNNEDLCYLYPNSITLQQSKNLQINYNAPDYKLYEIMVHENLKDMISKIMEHNRFKKVVFENGQVNLDFINEALNEANKMYVRMCPNYRNYDRNEVSQDILSGKAILGPRGGIVTMEYGIKYLGAITSAVSARAWLFGQAHNYKYKGSIKNPDGADFIKDMPKECQQNLIRMFIFKTIQDNTDCLACFQGYYFIDRDTVYEAIQIVRSKGQVEDALTETTKEILKLIFQKKESV